MNLLVAMVLSLLPPQGDERAQPAWEFGDPVPADRMWEAADSCYRRIAEALASEDYAEARRWDRFGRARLAKPYRNHLERAGEGLWHELLNLRRDLARVSLLTWSFRFALTPPAGKDLEELLGRLLHEPGYPEELWRPIVAAMWSQAAQGEWDGALRTLQALVTRVPNPSQGHPLSDARKVILDLKARPQDPEVLAEFTRHAFSSSAGPPPHFAHMMRLLRKAMDASTGPDGVAIARAAANVLRGAGDEAGARAREDKLFQDARAGEDDLAQIVFQRAHDAFKRRDFGAAEAGFRKIVQTWPRTRVFPMAFYNLGYTLMEQERYADARGVYEQLLKADVNDEDPGGHVMEAYRNYRPKGALEIAECYEAEGDWKNAYEAYVQARDRYHMLSWCGTCQSSYERLYPERIARCLVKLQRHDEAMKIYETELLSPHFSPPSSRLVLEAVDLYVSAGKVAELEEKIRAMPSDTALYRSAKRALDYGGVLRLRAKRDVEGLFLVIESQKCIWDLRNGWESFRQNEGWLAAEALECLADLGDEAVEFLIPRARRGGQEGLKALAVMARISTPRAKELTSNLDWVQGYKGNFEYELRRVAEGSSRSRARLPDDGAHIRDRDRQRGSGASSGSSPGRRRP